MRKTLTALALSALMCAPASAMNLYEARELREVLLTKESWEQDYQNCMIGMQIPGYRLNSVDNYCTCVADMVVYMMRNCTDKEFAEAFETHDEATVIYDIAFAYCNPFLDSIDI